MEIKLGLLRIGDITIGAVNAEVFNPIAQRLEGVAVRADNDGHADQWNGAVRIYSERFGLRDGDVRRYFLAVEARMREVRSSTGFWT